MRECFDRMKEEAIGKKCPICDEEFVPEDKPIMECDHRVHKKQETDRDRATWKNKIAAGL